ncbi:MAG TPA: hypothetical protein PLY87_21065 [Planctomycetaceae bacterium]|nr:hypothetical protein [Planctomycetaceae bacterium]HQZ67600.1 hypothetical protein [Planctomycetaceae bacterium]
MKHQLTRAQQDAAEACLQRCGDELSGKLRLLLKSCFYSAIARSVIGSLTGMPWGYDEETLAKSIDKSKGTLSQLKIPGKHDGNAPAFVGLRTLWKREFEKQQDLQIRNAAERLFQFGCVHYFERLGIFAFSRLLSDAVGPGLTGDLMAGQTLRWLQEAVFIYQWHPDDSASISIDALRARYPSASESVSERLANIMSEYGRPALLFYHLAVGANLNEQLA